MSLGNIPARYDVALRTTKLDRVVEYEPADLTITVEAGITIGKLQSALAEHGQFLPIDAPADATVGGVLAAGVSGPSRHAYGLPRDWLIGCCLALADGTLIKCGGRVVKNVAGYDMTKLAVGSLGTLGVIIEATFKLAPLPAAQETLVAMFDSIDAAAKCVFAADERRLSLRGVVLHAEADRPADVYFWLAGARGAVDRSTSEIAPTGLTAVERVASDILQRLRWRPYTSIELRAVLPSAEVGGFMDRVLIAGQERGLLPRCYSYPTSGVIFVSLEPEWSDKCAAFADGLRSQIEAAGGSLVVTAAPVEVKQQVDVWGDAGSALPLMRNLKQQFDPRSTLNPGRFMGRL
jgi:glycolate oxidase FAD binding subunit